MEQDLKTNRYRASTLTQRHLQMLRNVLTDSSALDGESSRGNFSKFLSQSFLDDTTA